MSCLCKKFLFFKDLVNKLPGDKSPTSSDLPEYKVRPFSPTSPSTWEAYGIETNSDLDSIARSSFVTIDLDS
jgi:hypothetical protein